MSGTAKELPHLQRLLRQILLILSQHHYRIRHAGVRPRVAENATASPFSVHEYSHYAPRKTKQALM
jgi:hypothetical protein